MEEFSRDYEFRMETLQALNEGKLISKYKECEKELEEKIEMVESTLEQDDGLSYPSQRKLLLIAFCQRKNKGKYDDILEKLYKNNKKNLLFNILLDYPKEFGDDIKFQGDEGEKIYKEFVSYSISKGQYKKSLEYRNKDIIQIEILYDEREKIFDKVDTIIFHKLNDYFKAYDLIKDLIEFEKEKKRKFVSFPKDFWEGYYNYYDNSETNEKKIEKLFELYNLLLSYINLGNDDCSHYEKTLKDKIHNLISGSLEKIATVKKQLEIVFEKDPEYVYSFDDRDCDIFKNIKLLDLKEEEDIKYFKDKNMEEIYKKNFKDFLSVIFEKIENIENFNSIIKIIEIKEQSNRDTFITMLIDKYSKFEDKELTEKSFLNLLSKIKVYCSGKNLEFLEKILDDFLKILGKKNNTIYLEILKSLDNKLDVELKDEKEEKEKIEFIKEKVAILSINNLDSFALKIDLIKKLDEKQKIDYFNNLNSFVINSDDFFKKETSQNLELLTEFVHEINSPLESSEKEENNEESQNGENNLKRQLIPESLYLKNSKELLNKIYNNLINYDEKKENFSETIIKIINDETQEKQEIYNLKIERFELFKLINDKFDSQSEFDKIKNEYEEVSKDIVKANEILDLLSNYYKKKYLEDMNKINSIYESYSKEKGIVKEWISQKDVIKKFIDEFCKEADLIREVKDIILFNVIYSDLTEEDEKTKFDKAIELLKGCDVIFSDISKGNKDIFNKWQKKFKKGIGIDKELEKLKQYYKINENKDLNEVSKKILIFTKKNIYKEHIEYILYFFNLFKVTKGKISKNLEDYQNELKDENLGFDEFIKINNDLEKLEIYINGGKDDSPSIKLIKEFYGRENEINFIKTKDVDGAATLVYRLSPTTDSLKFNDIMEYQSSIDFIQSIKDASTDENLLNKLKDKLKKINDIKIVISFFKNYFDKFPSIKFLDENFDESKSIYGYIKSILYNSKFEIKFFKRNFKVYDEDKKEKDIIAKDLDGLIQLKDNISLNSDDLPNKLSSEKKAEIEERNKRIKIFVKYVEQIQNLNKYFQKLESKGCPFLIDISILASKDEIIFKLMNEILQYNKLLVTLKEFCFSIEKYQAEFYEKNVYFRLVYDKQLYRLFKRTYRRDVDISSYIRFFTNGDSIEDKMPAFDSYFSNQAEAYKDHKKAIEEKYQLISDYIQNLFKINNTSLEKLYEDIKVRDNYHGIYTYNIKPYNADLFIIKIFLKLTGNFPIAQNILLTNNETSIGEINSFIYRAIKCQFNALFVVSISNDFSKNNLNKMTSLINKIIRNMKDKNIIKKAEDLTPCILFIFQNTNSKDIININDAKDAKSVFPKNIIGDENKNDAKDAKTFFADNIIGDENNLDNQLGKGKSKDSHESLEKEIYEHTKIYTSDYSGLGKSFRIKNEIHNNGEDYHYFGVGDDITKGELFKKLKKFLKYEIKGKHKAAIHLDLYYTKNVQLMKYFLFSFLITKLYQANDNILYIPKNINIYVELPNGPQKFLDDYPILTIFKTFNITLKEQLPLSEEIYNDKLTKNLIVENEINEMTYIEKKIYLNIINYLCPNNSSDKNEQFNEKIEKIKNLAKNFSKNIYSEKLRTADISMMGKDEKEIKEYIFEFFDFDEKTALDCQYKEPLIFNTKNGYVEIDLSDDELQDKDLDYFVKKLKIVMSLEESEEEIKKSLGEYQVTQDNYKKFMLILFKIFSNIPIILMGETGCGKTELIKQLMKLLNKDNENKTSNFIIKNMHSGVKEKEIIDIIDNAEKNLQKIDKDNAEKNLQKKDEEYILCIFFDEINTTSLLSKMKEIFVDHSLNGKPIDERIRFIGACNPFRKNKNDENEEGLKLNKDDEKEMTYMVNPLPNSLLNFIFYFKSLDDKDVIKYIESIIGKEFPKGTDKDEDIKSIIKKVQEGTDKDENSQKKEDNKNEVKDDAFKKLKDNNSILRTIAIIAIYKSHKFVREKNGISSVSLRDLQRFRRTYNFFYNEYYKYKKEFLLSKQSKTEEKEELSDIKSKFLSFILSIFITYYIKIFKSGNINDYKQDINPYVNYLVKKFAIEFKSKDNVENIDDIIHEEQDFLLDEMDVKNEKGIGLNNSLKENIFLMFFSIYAHIPLIVVGKPGCSKSLSIQLIIRIMRGEFSQSDLLKKFPQINHTGFQGSETNTPESIESIFEVAENKIDLDNIPKPLEDIIEETQKSLIKEVINQESINKVFEESEKKIDEKKLNNSKFIKNIFKDAKEKIEETMDENKLDNSESIIKTVFEDVKKKLSKKKYLSLLVFDELGLSERSPTNCLKVLHSKLEMSLDPKEQKQVSFIGISNWRLDAAKMNRAIFLSIPDLKSDDIKTTVEAIAKSYGENIYEDYKNEYNLLGKLYYEYKLSLKKEFGEAIEQSGEAKEQSDKKKSDDFINNYHGGRDLYNLVKIFSSKMLNYHKKPNQNVINEAVLNSLARNLSGLEIDGKSSLSRYIKDEKIKFDNLNTMELIKDNILSKDSRFLLLSSEKSMFSFLMDFIKKEIEKINNNANNKINYVTYIGSPFKGDRMNISYQTEVIVNIEKSVAEGKVIILSDLEQIYSIFYDLFNQNYIKKDGKYYCRISHGVNIQKLALVNENTKFIVLVDKKDLRKQKLPFLSRFEKHIISFDNLLIEGEKEKSKEINDILKKMISVNKINYNLDNLLININEDIINGYVYLLRDNKNRKDISQEIIKDKVLPILPQDILLTLPLSDLSKTAKEMNIINNNLKLNIKYNSLDEYLQNNKERKEKILIIYTFTNTAESIKLSNKEDYIEKLTTEIYNVYKFKHILNEFYQNNHKSSLILKFESENSKFINFFISEIQNYQQNNINNKNKEEIDKESNENKYINLEDKNFIFTINIKREFDKNKKTHKVTSVLITDEKIKQLFIDNINGSELSINDIKKINIENYINKEPKRLIIEEMLKFYRENKSLDLGMYKGIDTNNFILEFSNFIKKSEVQNKKEKDSNDSEMKIEEKKTYAEEIIDDIKKLIVSQISNDKIIDTFLDKQFINENTVDIITAIISYMKNIFNEKMALLLSKTENNNFFTTLFMLNVENKGKDDISPNNNTSNYSFNMDDKDILNNKTIKNIKKEYLKILKTNLKEKSDDTSINIKLNYKIPGFFNIYREIKSYLEKEKILVIYKQDETDVRKCQYEFISSSKSKLSRDLKDFQEKLLSELKSKQLFKIITDVNIDPKFIELFLNDYITFYLENLYNNVIKDFAINDIPHKIILLILDLKYKESTEKEKETNENILQKTIDKILWLGANSKYIKNIIDLYNIISESLVYDEKDNEFLFNLILKYISINQIKYEPDEESYHLIDLNKAYYIIIIILFKCMLDEQSFKNSISKNEKDNYYSYFKDLERCLKEMQMLDKMLKLDIKELSLLNEFINIYNVFEKSGKVGKLDLLFLIGNLKNSLEIIQKNDKSKIQSLCKNLKTLIEKIKESLYDESKINEIKGDVVYYELLSNIFISELERENNPEYKMYILKEFLLKDEKLFIQSTQLLKMILEDFVTSKIDKFQGSLDYLSKEDLNILEEKADNEWIKETLIYCFEYITNIYIQNLIKENEERKKEDQKNIIYDLKSYFGNCISFLKKLYNNKFSPVEDSSNNDKNGKEDEEEIKEENEEDKNSKSNIKLKTFFALAFIRTYLKLFIDWINKGLLTKQNEIKEIIDIINNIKDSKDIVKPFRNMVQYYIYKIIYNINVQKDEDKDKDEHKDDNKDISKLFDGKIIEKFHLKNCSNFDLLQKEEEHIKYTKNILFIESYKANDKEFTIYDQEFKILSTCLKNSGDKESELIELIKSNNIDIFYSVFNLVNNKQQDDDKKQILANIIENNFDDKEKLLNIFKLFLDITKYTKSKIKPNEEEILKFSLRFCINADKISDDYENIYYPLYNASEIGDVSSYIPGNDIKESKVYKIYSRIKNYLYNNPSSHGVYLCVCNLDKEDEETTLKFIEENGGFPQKQEKCKFCGQPIGNENGEKDFYKRDFYYRIFKNEKELKNEIKDKINGNCITLDQFFEGYLSNKLEEDSKGINISKKEYFDNPDKPIRKQSQICYRLMNLILYSHLFTNVLFTNKEEIFKCENLSYLDYIVKNWNKLKLLLQDEGKDIYIFMNLIYKDLLAYLNKQKKVNEYDKLLKIENEIEKLVENKIFKKSEKIKDKLYSKYEMFLLFYNKNKQNFIEKTNNIITIITESNNANEYTNEKDYPYYKSFLYSDYQDNNFYKNKLEEKGKEKYPVTNLFLNKENKVFKNNKLFIYFNNFIKLLVNQYSCKIRKEEAEKIKLEETNIYKENEKGSELFIKIINSKKKGINLNKESTLDNFLITKGSEKGKILFEIYESQAQMQNDFLKDITQKINSNSINSEEFAPQEINIQEAQREDLLTLEFENKSEANEIFLSNTFREIYNIKSKIKYNNYNINSVNFDKIEKSLEDRLIKKAKFLKTDEIIEMKFSEEDYFDDGINEFNKIIKPKNLDDKEKMAFLKFYEKIKTNLTSCLEINSNLKNIIKFINKDIQTKKNKSLSDIIKEYPDKINDYLKEFLTKNTIINLNNLVALIIFFENLYFELAIEKNNQYKEQLDQDTKDKIDKYYKEKNGQLITKEKLSLIIVKFIINIINNGTEIIKLNDNLFDCLNNRFLWKNETYLDKRFTKELGEYKDLNIYVKNSYDFYCEICSDYRDKFKNENQEILAKIKDEENDKKLKDKEDEIAKQKEKLETPNDKDNEGNTDMAADVDEGDYEGLEDFD